MLCKNFLQGIHKRGPQGGSIRGVHKGVHKGGPRFVYTRVTVNNKKVFRQSDIVVRQ